MTVLFWVSWTGALAAAWLLAAAGAGHLRRPGRLRAALAAQRLGQGWGRAVIPFGLLELLTGASLLIGFAASGMTAAAGRRAGAGGGVTAAEGATSPASAALTGSMIVAAGLFAGFAVHLQRVRRRAPGAPCGCFGDEPVSGLLVGRALLLAGCLGLAWWTSLQQGAPPPVERGVLLAAAALVALMLVVVPSLFTLGSIAHDGAVAPDERPASPRRSGRGSDLPRAAAAARSPVAGRRRPGPIRRRR